VRKSKIIDLGFCKVFKGTLRQEQSTGYSNLDPRFGSGKPMVDAIKHTRGTTRRRQCEDGVGAVVQGIIDFEHHSLADVANVAVAILRNSKTDSEYKSVTALENTKSIGNLIPVAKVADAAVASAGNLKNWRAVAGRSVSGTEGFAPSKSRK
jgi:hypothetical protein